MSVGDFATVPDFSAAVAGVDSIVHLAAHVHQMKAADDDEQRYDAVNRQATLALARAAIDANVRRFVFLSSIKAVGEARQEPYTEDDEPAPTDAYGRSKLEAELGLRTLAQSNAFAPTILRPPLVYGPGVGANFLRLIQLTQRLGFWPFGNQSNRRSFIFVKKFG